MNALKVLIPLDGSEFSEQILPYLTKFFTPEMHHLVFLRVDKNVQGLTPAPPITPIQEYRDTMFRTHQDAKLAKHPIYANQMRDSQEAQLQDELRQETAAVRQAGFSITYAAKFGDPATEILETIEEEAIDLVAMTTHGRTGLSRVVFGSVAEKVLHKMSVPIMLLRPTLQSLPEDDIWTNNTMPFV